MALKREEDFNAQLSGSMPEQETSSSSWFKRRKKGISTSTAEKKETPDGLWTKCPSCKYTCTTDELKINLSVCPKCNYHHRIGSEEYFDILFDDQQYTELFEEVKSIDFLGFNDLKPYKKRLDEAYSKTGLHDSITAAVGKVNGQNLVISCMDFNFIGGSLGSVMGEKIARSAEYCLQHRIPLMIISKSGGARMMESAFSLMQLPKTIGKISKLAVAGIPYISLCTDPTYGGTTASFAMVGDVNIGEPGAMIGFAGPRVIKETIKKDLPEGFQTSEFLIEHGFLDMIVGRKELKNKIATLLSLFAS
ncbi:MAG: acetyl-CoA carboxylase, carboxyltransferase subunit beta [Chitinophagaceae bacterium]|jgi:acetyl-CoA carboxylase carboxyl transferase subunit beta|nr:acetyl-CoA carboxylase, carboxyltransferase subunit beta [Chitinophagaceae bacterium]